MHFEMCLQHSTTVAKSCTKFVFQGLQSTKRDAYGRLVLGDIITSVNGTKVTNGSDLYRILDQCKVGETVSFDLCLQNKKYVTIL
jgi:S1-C subfamily serine protease